MDSIRCAYYAGWNIVEDGLTKLIVGNFELLNGDYSAKLIIPSVDPAHFLACQRLRYNYFVCQRQWVAPDKTQSEIECDEYDDQAQHLAVFQGTQVVGYLRVIDRQASCGFMLEHDFRHLVAKENWPLIRQIGGIEISRLAISREIPYRAAKNIFLLLFKLLYQLSLQQDYRHYVIVVEPHWLPLFARRFGFAFSPIGPVTPFPDGTLAVAAHAAVTGLEDVLFHQNPTLLAWFQSPQE
jgi:N-acyl-L-homoserine lactone synthetase